VSVFADASALVKLYADEAGAQLVRDLEVLVVAQVSRVEVPAALWRKHRSGELSVDEARLLVAEFEADLFGTADQEPRFAVVAVSQPIYDDAARLVAVHGLRAYDAVQLAAGRAARAVDPGCDEVAAFDRHLRAAAAKEGFGLVPDGA
jgi:predicted nucleic acid-binding protein